MFKVNESYKIKMRDNGETTDYHQCKVIAVDMPLIKVVQGGKEIVLNTGSLAFVSAQRDD
jgi:hypothetical protein